MLLDLIEEFYEELLAALGRIDHKAGAKRDKLHNLIRAHLNLHQEMPWHFRLVDVTAATLNDEQQARVRQLREQYEGTLRTDARQPLAPQRTGVWPPGHAIANLLNSPCWLAQRTGEQARDELLENLIGGAIERLLRPALPRAAAPDISGATP